MTIFKNFFLFALSCLILALIIPVVGRFWADDRYGWVLVYALMGGLFAGFIIADVVSLIKQLRKRFAPAE